MLQDRSVTQAIRLEAPDAALIATEVAELPRRADLMMGLEESAGADEPRGETARRRYRHLPDR